MGDFTLGDVEPVINFNKKVDTSLQEEDERFAPKVRAY
jgi:hypothetical protein